MLIDVDSGGYGEQVGDVLVAGAGVLPSFSILMNGNHHRGSCEELNANRRKYYTFQTQT